MRRIKKSILSSPYFWVAMGTLVLPLNLLCALGFWMVSKRRTGKATKEAKRCLNVQFTYLMIFLLPIGGAAILTNGHWPMPATLLMGFSLGMISLAAVVSLSYFNVRIFVENVFGKRLTPIPRIHFVPE